MAWRHGAFSRRDAILLLMGAFSMHIWSLILGQPTIGSSLVVTDMNGQELPLEEGAGGRTTLTVTHISTKVVNGETETLKETLTEVRTTTATSTQTTTTTALSPPTAVPQYISPTGPLPHTSILAHAPGWTLFRNIYMSNGTLLILADENERGAFPEIRMMTSTGLIAINSPENIALREPTKENMDFVTEDEAMRRWGARGGGMNRVLSVEGNTVLFNDPDQFLRHYYHFVAELWFGVQAFWHGAFSTPVLTGPSDPSHFSLVHPAPPPIHRAIFTHSNANGWRDDPGFNRYFLRAVLPSLTVEHQEDWEDRIVDTRQKPLGKKNADGSGEQMTPERAFHFPLLLLTDRSAAHRGVICGSQTQRTAAEAWDVMRLKGKLRGIHVGGWWAPIRDAMWRFAGAPQGHRSDALSRLPESSRYTGLPDGYEVLNVVGMNNTLDPGQVVVVNEHKDQKELKEPSGGKIVISYITRQTGRHRKLIQEDHEALVKALKGLVEKKNAERMKALAMFDAEGDLGEDYDRRKRASVPLEWEFDEVIAERLTHDEQIRMAARTTFMVGVHGNGLTHLVFMEPTRYSTVIELFFPNGFAHDYQWTTRSLGMTHFAVWNDTYRTAETKPEVAYPEGFQENSIPVYGPLVAQLIEDRVDGIL